MGTDLCEHDVSIMCNLDTLLCINNKFKILMFVGGVCKTYCRSLLTRAYVSASLPLIVGLAFEPESII